MAKEKAKTQTEEYTKDRKKNLVGTIGSRGRSFQGKVIRKFEKRVTIELERTVKIQKYERFMKKKTRIHARLPDEFSDQVNIGDIIRVQECRPLSKTIHFIFLEKIRDADHNSNLKEVKK